MKLAVMQPYFFPYIGYFQMINAVDVFVFYDDVNFIKRGWINRNKILVNGSECLLTIPCIKASQNKYISDIKINKQHKNVVIVLVCHSGVMAALRASHIGQDFGEHNISEAYPHDYVGKFTFNDGVVTSFEEFKG